jgi:hypothetical protein
VRPARNTKLINRSYPQVNDTTFPPESKQRMDAGVLKRFNFPLTEGKSGEFGKMTNGSWGKQAKSARNWLKMRHGP